MYMCMYVNNTGTCTLSYIIDDHGNYIAVTEAH